MHRGAVHSLRAAEQFRCAQSGLQEPQTLQKSFYVILDKLSLLLLKVASHYHWLYLISALKRVSAKQSIVWSMEKQPGSQN